MAAVNISLSSTGDQLKQATKERDRSNAALKQAKVNDTHKVGLSHVTCMSHVERGGDAAADLCSHRCHSGVPETAGD